MVHERLQQKRMELLGRVETELEAVWGEEAAAASEVPRCRGCGARP